jgi:hypothetical protein
MKKLSIPCSFGPQNHSVDFYVGQPRQDKHPIQSQSNWLSSARGGSVPGNVMQSLEKLHELSVKNRVNFADLCEYAVQTAESSPKVEAKTESANNKIEQSSQKFETKVESVDDQESLLGSDKDVQEVSKTVSNSQPVASSVSQSNSDFDLSSNRDSPESVAQNSPASASQNLSNVDSEAGMVTGQNFAKNEVGKSASTFNLQNHSSQNSDLKNSQSKKDDSKLTDDDIDSFLNS